MKSKQMMFFVLFEDIEPIFRDIEALIDIRYYKSGMFYNKSIPTYNSIFEIPNIGFTSSGDWNCIDNYLIMKTSTTLNVEVVPQRKGGVKFAVDQLMNPKSIDLKLGGIYKEKENVIVAGRISTVSNENDSNELYKLFTSKFKKKFKRIGAFYVGKNAEDKLKIGWRLVTDEKSPQQYDLAFS